MSPHADIRKKIVEVLAGLLSWEKDKMDQGLDKLYWINSYYAAMQCIPKDILVHFLRKTMGDQVFQCHFSSRFKIDNVTVIVLKEIPIEKFIFLTEILKQKRIPFHLEKNLTEMNF